MKMRWICLFVENEIGVLARISGLLSGKAYNIESLTVGPTEDESISRMTIGLYSNDQIFEQIVKQLNRTVEVIKVLDYSDIPIHRKEIMFLKVTGCSSTDKNDLITFAQVYGVTVLDFNKTTVLLECIKDDSENERIVKLLKDRFAKPVEIVRGGSVAVEAV